ncbi:MAG: S41 family peptidase [Verrucomicrobiales bacterium]
MKRRTFTCLLASGAWGVRADPPPSEAYEQDVAFLLEELPKHAGRCFELKKIDWPAVESEFRAAVKTVKSDGEHLILCRRLMARLKDGHAGIVDAKTAWPDESHGRRWTGPRVHLVVIDEAVFVRAAFGEAAELGLKPGLRVETIDGRPARQWLEAKVAELRDRTGYSTDHQALHAACHWGLADWSGTTITFIVAADQVASREVAIVRNGGPNFAPIGPVFFPKDVRSLGRQSYGKTAEGLGYIHLRDVPGDLPAQIDTMLAALGEVPGLILDMRGNGGGGCDHATVIGRFLPKGTFWGEYESAGATPFTGPMVVIVDAGTRSAGETVAGLFIQESRGYGLGDSPTAGMSAAKMKLTVPSGQFSANFAVRSHRHRWNKGRGIEGLGISPTQVLPYDPGEMLAGIDTQIRRAEQLLQIGFPPDSIDYQPPVPAGR